MMKKILYVGAILFLGGWVGFWVQKTVQQTTTTTSTTPTPAANAPSKIMRQESAIATQSAFLRVSQSVASLSASVQTLTITDTMLNPPAIELPLGFDTK